MRRLKVSKQMLCSCCNGYEFHMDCMRRFLLWNLEHEMSWTMNHSLEEMKRTQNTILRHRASNIIYYTNACCTWS